MKLILKEDLIIPKGTVFELMEDYNVTFYQGNNCEAKITMQDTTCMRIFVPADLEDDRFKTVFRWEE